MRPAKRQRMVSWMDDLPNEVVWNIALDLPYRSVLALCTTSVRFAALCREDDFWRDKAAHDFNVTVRKWPTWRESYRWLMRQPRHNRVVVRYEDGSEDQLPLTVLSDARADGCNMIYFRATQSPTRWTGWSQLLLQGNDGYPVIAQPSWNQSRYNISDELYLMVYPELATGGMRMYLRGAVIARVQAAAFGPAYQAYREDCMEDGGDDDDMWIARPTDINPHLGWSPAQEVYFIRELLKALLLGPDENEPPSSPEI